MKIKRSKLKKIVESYLQKKLLTEKVVTNIKKQIEDINKIFKDGDVPRDEEISGEDAYSLIKKELQSPEELNRIYKEFKDTLDQIRRTPEGRKSKSGKTRKKMILAKRVDNFDEFEFKVRVLELAKNQATQSPEPSAEEKVARKEERRQEGPFRPAEDPYEYKVDEDTGCWITKKKTSSNWLQIKGNPRIGSKWRDIFATLDEKYPDARTEEDKEKCDSSAVPSSAQARTETGEDFEPSPEQAARPSFSELSMWLNKQMTKESMRKEESIPDFLKDDDNRVYWQSNVGEIFYLTEDLINKINENNFDLEPELESLAKIFTNDDWGEYYANLHTRLLEGLKDENLVKRETLETLATELYLKNREIYPNSTAFSPSRSGFITRLERSSSLGNSKIISDLKTYLESDVKSDRGGFTDQNMAAISEIILQFKSGLSDREYDLLLEMSALILNKLFSGYSTSYDEGRIAQIIDESGTYFDFFEQIVDKLSGIKTGTDVNIQDVYEAVEYESKLQFQTNSPFKNVQKAMTESSEKLFKVWLKNSKLL